MKIIPLETEEAKTLKAWADYHPIAKHYLMHIANEGKRTWRAGKKLKAEGMKKGVADYLLAFPTGEYHGLFIELKRVKNSRVTLEQMDFLEKQRKVGYKSVVAYGAAQAIKEIENYLNKI